MNLFIHHDSINDQFKEGSQVDQQQREQEKRIFNKLCHLVYGMEVIKQSDGKQREKIIYVNEKYPFILNQIDLKQRHIQYILLDMIEQKSDSFKGNIYENFSKIINKQSNTSNEHFCIINQKSTHKSYKYIFKTKQKKLQFKESFDYCINVAYQYINKIGQMQKSAIYEFIKFDIDGGGYLSQRQLMKLSATQNMSLNSKQILPLIKQINIQQLQKVNGQLSYSISIETFLKLLRFENIKFPLLNLFQKYVIGFPDFTPLHQKKKIQQVLAIISKPVMTINSLTKFFNIEQGQNISPYLAQKIAIKYGAEKIGGETKISFENFCNLLLSDTNSVFDQKLIKKYQSMNHPITHYYIYSSHNTYISKSQISGQSKVEMYQQALDKGCRCVELDIYVSFNYQDGPKKQPIVTHGGTAVSSILFQDIIKKILQKAENMFFQENTTPIVFSFQNHASYQVRQTMADILEQAFGKRIYSIESEAKDAKFWPSVSDLEYKILIKGDGELQEIMHVEMKEIKRTFTKSKQIISNSSQQEQEVEKSFVLNKNISNDNQISRIGYSNKIQHLQIPQEFKNIQQEIETEENLFNLEFQSEMKNIENILSTANVKLNEANKQILKLKKLSYQYQKIVIKGQKPKKNSVRLMSKTCILNSKLNIANIKTESSKKSIWYSCSVVSSDIEKWVKQPVTIDSLVSYTRNHFIRVYPPGTNFASGNYNPICMQRQQIPLKQVHKQQLQIYIPMICIIIFFQNGLCGYVLKPQYMRNQDGQLLNQNKIIIKLKMTVLCGQRLTSNKKSLNQEAHQLTVKFMGAYQDQNRKCNVKSFQSQYISNAFNPNYKNLECQFRMTKPYFGNIYIQIMGKQNKFGSISLPVHLIKRGYRKVPILNDKMKIKSQQCLICFFQIGN